MSELEPVLSENELIAVRREKLKRWREAGGAYPNQVFRDVLAQSLHDHYAHLSSEALIAEKIPVHVAGRIMLRRLMGKASFTHLQDMSGQIQIYLRTDALPDGVYEDFKTWDIGDIIGVSGYLFKTKTGELSIHADAVQLVTKSLKPLPDKFHGLVDIERCYRQRYLDLIVNPETRARFIARSRLVQRLRELLSAAGFLEVETPMMQALAGGAAARPFVTEHNALDRTLYLRIAPELYLKRLVVGGFEKVFELNRNFRNEGLSTRHNPEFTMLEFYQAFADYLMMMDFTESLLQTIAKELHPTGIVEYQGESFDFNQPFQRLTMAESICQFNPFIEADKLRQREALCAYAERLHIPIKDSDGLGKIQLEIFEKTVEHQLKRPTFITAYPAEVSPLARCNDADPFITDRFEFFVGGREIANGFSELNDPDDQAKRFQHQMTVKAAGDAEAMPYDEDYIEALEYGMPPTAGVGIGIDRLAMLLTDAASIRDVILFPHLREE